jgi:DNA polymerase-3 subunit alpha (Gram-positive type)
MKKLIPAILSLFVRFAAAAPLSATVFVAFDVETTGFSPANERIIEIGAVKYRDGKIIDSAQWLINPGRPIRNTHVHQISDEMVAESPAFPAAYRAFAGFAGTSVLLAHNASFDVRFMKAEIERNQLNALPNPVINTLALYRSWYPEAPSHKLSSLAEHLQLPADGRHRAESDAKTLIQVLRHGLAARSGLTLQQMQTEANGVYYFDGSRK